MKIILSIKPQYCEEIFAGEKRFEYRRKIFQAICRLSAGVRDQSDM